MTKHDCIEYVLKCIYKDNYPLILNRNTIRKIEKFYYIIAKTTRFTSGCRRAVGFTVRPLSFAKPIER